MKNPLRKRLPIELKSELGKYLVVYWKVHTFASAFENEREQQKKEFFEKMKYR